MIHEVVGWLVVFMEALFKTVSHWTRGSFLLVVKMAIETLLSLSFTKIKSIPFTNPLKI